MIEAADRERIASLLDFWFGPGDVPREVWFKRDDAFDVALRECFATDVEAAASGRLDHWSHDPEGALALVLLLDQLPRNLYRGSPRAWASDPAARAAASRAIAAGHDRRLSAIRRAFLYLPFEHSEEMADQERSLRLFRSIEDHPEREELLRYAERHHEIIARFGRFPHRNAVLGRASTDEEKAFLSEPFSAF
jgi:uncharacterized protein (DUF924 family)